MSSKKKHSKEDASDRKLCIIPTPITCKWYCLESGHLPTLGKCPISSVILLRGWSFASMHKVLELKAYLMEGVQKPSIGPK